MSKRQQEKTETDKAWDRTREYWLQRCGSDSEIDPVTLRPTPARDKMDTALVNAIVAKGATPEWIHRLTIRVMTNAVAIAHSLRSFDQLPVDFATELGHKAMANLPVGEALRSLWSFMNVAGKHMARDLNRKRKVRSCPSLPWKVLNETSTPPTEGPPNRLALDLLSEFAARGERDRQAVQHLVHRDALGIPMPDIARAAGVDRRTVSRPAARALAEVRSIVAARYPQAIERASRRAPEGYQIWKQEEARRGGVAPGGKRGQAYMTFWRAVGEELRTMGVAG